MWTWIVCCDSWSISFSEECQKSSKEEDEGSLVLRLKYLIVSPSLIVLEELRPLKEIRRCQWWCLIRRQLLRISSVFVYVCYCERNHLSERLKDWNVTISAVTASVQMAERSLVLNNESLKQTSDSAYIWGLCGSVVVVGLW